MNDTTVVLSRPRKRAAATSWSVFGDGITPGDIVSTDAVAVERHHEYLARMSIEGVVPAEVSAKARKAWELARAAVPGLPVPIAIAHDGGPIHYTWDNDRHVIALECLSGDQPCEWYVSDRQTGQFDGGDFDLAGGLPSQVVAMLVDYLAMHPTGHIDGNR